MIHLGCHLASPFLEGRIMKLNRICGISCGVLTGVCWGLSGVFSQYLFTNTNMESGWFVAVRMFISGIFMMLYSIITKEKEVRGLVKNKRDFFICVMTGIVGTMLFQFTCYGAVQRSNAATAIVLQYLCPVMVMIFMCLKEQKYPTKFETLALIAALGGVFLIATHGNFQEMVITGEALIWGVGCAFFMSLTTILPTDLYEKYSIQTITSFALVSGGIVASIVIKPWKYDVILDTKAMLALLFAIICGSLIAYIMYGVSIKQVGSGKASLYACAEIPTATILSVILLGNSFVWQDIVGFLLIGSTIFISTGGNKK